VTTFSNTPIFADAAKGAENRRSDEQRLSFEGILTNPSSAVDRPSSAVDRPSSDVISAPVANEDTTVSSLLIRAFIVRLPFSPYPLDYGYEDGGFLFRPGF
jgi:hypothetical protein